MIEVGAYQARTHFSELIDKVNDGEEILITKRGKAIARLVPAAQFDQSRLIGTITELMTLRKEITLRDVDWRELRDEGRR